MATPIQEITESLNIEQDNKKYLLIMKIKGDTINFMASDPEEEGLSYSRKMALKEIKEKNEKYFAGLYSCKEFSDYLKALSEDKKVSIMKKEDKLSINFTVEYLLKKHPIEIYLYPEKYNSELININLYKKIN